MNTQWQDAVAACRVLGAATLLWPAAAEMTGAARRPTTRAMRQERRDARVARRAAERLQVITRQRSDLATHSWIHVGKTRRCASCLQWHRLGMPPCAGTPIAWEPWLRAVKEQGHSLRYGMLHDRAQREQMPMVICTHCGVWTATGGQASSSKMLDPCGQPSKAGKMVLGRVARGLHPKASRHPVLCSLGT